MLTYDEVLRIAVKAHEGQIDKTGLPYILHPVRVAERLRARGMPLWIVHAGLLHDVIEDTDLTADDMKAAGVLPSTVAVVEGVTRDKSDGKTYHEWVQGMVGNPIVATLKYEDASDNLVRNESLISEDPKKAASLRKKYNRVLDTLRDSLLY